MVGASERLSVYRELAERYDQLGQVSMRDRFLLLAAAAALELGQHAEAERFRQRVLNSSPHHIIAPYASFTAAAENAEVCTYIDDLHINYPLEVAVPLLESMRGDEETGLDQTRPLDFDATPARAAPLPPTAPLMDVNGPKRRESNTYPLRPDPSPSKPLGTPVPGRRTVQRPAAPAPAPTRPASHSSSGVPRQPAQASQGIPRPLPPVSHAPPASMPIDPLPPVRERTPRRKHKTKPSGWFSMALLGLVLLAGLAWAGFTLARPFLSGMLP